jgi:adenosylcobinamide-GDP ribazoletransferase
MLKPIVGAISLLSRIPVGSISLKESDVKKSVMHFPLTGILAFIVYYLSYTILITLQFDNYLVVLLSLTVTYYLFNLFHFDGFLDSIDGLLSQKSKDNILEIMRKGNIGPTGIFFGIIYILIKIFLMEKIYIVNLLAMFVLSRWGLSFACVAGRPARDEGLGKLFLGAKQHYFIIATSYVMILPFICTVYFLSILASALSVIAVDYLVIVICTKKINGINGDILGFINEINELLVLAILYHAKSI